METKHTPGPWKTDGITIYADAAQSGMVADCRAQMSGTRANARLIAAAPTMLAALEAVIERFDFGMVPEMPRLESQLRAAIAIAKGEE